MNARDTVVHWYPAKLNKRGQATIFIILGLIILAVLIILFLLKGSLPLLIVSPEAMDNQMNIIDEHIQECLNDAGETAMWKIAKQGGYLYPADFTSRQYFDGTESNKVSYLCYNIKDQQTCRNRMLTKKDIEEQLTKEILLNAEECIKNFPINLRLTARTPEEPQLQTIVGQDSTILSLNYPITLIHKELKSEQETFTTSIQLPLGRLYDSSQAIVNSEALVGNFETLVYSIKKTEYTGMPYMAQKLQPYPDKLYKIWINDYPLPDKEYVFQFFIQGEDRFE